MNVHIGIQTSEKLALRNPESTVLGQKIVRQGLMLMHELGYEHFTFKKLAERVDTTEASIYRYFENKHRLLLYYITLYWNLMEYSVLVALQNLTDPTQKINKVIELLSEEIPDTFDATGLDKKALYEIVVAESSKTYLTKEVDDINKDRLFKPYKDLCGSIAALFKSYNPDFEYPRSLASTLIEMAHFQTFFKGHLPLLTDVNDGRGKVSSFLTHMVFAALSPRKG